MNTLSLISNSLNDQYKMTLSRTRATFENSLNKSHQDTSQLSSLRQSRLNQRSTKPSAFILSYINNQQSSFNYRDNIIDNIQTERRNKQHKQISKLANHENQKSKVTKEYQKKKQKAEMLGKQLRQRMEIVMAYDNQRTNPKNYSDSPFIDGYTNIDIPLIPCTISRPDPEMMNFMEENQENCVYGLLDSIGFCYYAVNNVVYFQDLLYRIQYNNNNRDFKPQRVEFKKKVISIQEGQFKSAFLTDKDKVLIIRHPYGITICKYSLRDRQIIIRQQKMSLTTPFIKSDLLLTKCKRLFYLTIEGNLRQVSQRQISKWRSPFSNKRFYLKPEQYNEKFNDFMKRAMNKGINQTFHNLSKYFKKSLDSIISRIKQNNDKNVISFVMNQKLKLLVCLINNGSEIQMKCYSYQNEIQCKFILFEKDIIQLLNINAQIIRKQDYFKLDIPNLQQQQYCDLILVFKEGLRFLLKIQKDHIRRVQVVHPPSVNSYFRTLYNHLFEGFHVPSCKQLMTLQELINYKSIQKSKFMSFIGTQSAQVSSFFVYKSNMFEKQVISPIKFLIFNDDHHRKMLSEYIISYGCIPLEKTMAESYEVLFKLEKANISKCGMLTSQLHQLASQVHFNSKVYVFGNQSGTELKYKMRMIDIIFMLVFSQQISLEYIQSLFVRLIEQFSVHPSEIASMLLQIMIHKGGVYQIERGLMEKIVFMKSKQKVRKGYEHQSLRQQTMRLTHKQLNRQKWKKIDLLLHSLIKLNTTQSIFKSMIDINSIKVLSSDPFYHSRIQPRQQGIIIYFTRLMRPLWYIPLKNMKQQQVQLQQLLQRFQQVYQYIKVREIGSSLGYGQSKIQSTFKELIQRVFQIFQMCKIFNKVPNVSFSQCLYLSPESFQQCVIQNLIDGVDIQKLKMQFKRISLFVSYNTIEAIQIFQQFNQLNSFKQIISKIKQLQSIPYYIHNYLIKYKNFPQNIKLNIKNSSKSSQQNTLKIKPIIPYQNLNIKLNEILNRLQTLKKIKQINRHLQDKQQITKLQTQIKTIYIQNVIIMQYQTQCIPDLSKQTITRLKLDILSQVQIRSLVVDIKSQLVDLIYLINLSNHLDTDFLYQLTLQGLNLDNSKRNLIKRIKYIVNNIYNFTNIKQLLKEIIKILCIYHSHQKEFKNYLVYILGRNNKMKKPDDQIDTFWVVYIPIEIGYSQQMIEQAYCELLEEFISPDHALERQQQQSEYIFEINQKLSLVLGYMFLLKMVMKPLVQQRKTLIENIIETFKNKELLPSEQILKLEEYIETQILN